MLPALTMRQRQEIVMNARTPVPLRWSETAEAARVCGDAVLVREPRNAAARLVETGASDSTSAPPPPTPPVSPGLFSRLKQTRRKMAGRLIMLIG
jgi:hypothetical protein